MRASMILVAMMLLAAPIARAAEAPTISSSTVEKSKPAAAPTTAIDAPATAKSEAAKTEVPAVSTSDLKTDPAEMVVPAKKTSAKKSAASAKRARKAKIDAGESDPAGKLVERVVEISERTTSLATQLTIGVASYYASRFHGRTTASGVPYDETDLTAAHRSLPFGTLLRVTNLTNLRSVTVKVNDRGPYVKGRVIDLSRSAARKLGMIKPGLAKVRVEQIVEDVPNAPSSESDAYKGDF